MSVEVDPETTPGPEDEMAPLDRIFAPMQRSKAIKRVPRAGLTAVRTVRDAAPRTLYLALGLQVVSAVFVALQLLVIKYVVEELVTFAQSNDRSVSGLLPAFAGIFVTTTVTGLIAAKISQQQQLLDELVSVRVIDRIIDVATRVRLALFEDPRFYDELERATAAGMRRPTEMVNSLMSALLGTLTSVAVVGVLLALVPILVPLILLSGLPPLLATLAASRRTYAFEHGMTAHARERLHLFELFTDPEPAKELRVFDAVEYLKRRYTDLTDERVVRWREHLAARLRVMIIATLAGALGAAIALGALAWLLSTGRAGVSTAATAAVAMLTLAGRLSGVIGSLGTLVESSLFMEDLDRFLGIGLREAQAPRGAGATRGGANGRTKGAFESLEVEGLNFAYPQTGRTVLSDVSMSIRRGEVVALVGENGSGKTTLVKMLCQLYDWDEGSVRWNGTDVADLEPADVRAHMTVLFQDFVRYHLSVEDNIALGRPQDERDAERIRQAARQAGAEESIEALPHGFGTRLGRQFLGGHELSGGQWQRLALARAFYRGGDLLVLDEPTAALDPRAEYRLFEQMRELAAGKSVLLISHRFANVRMADRIYVLDRGRVVETGNHAALMERDGLYAELFRLQAAAYDGA